MEKCGNKWKECDDQKTEMLEPIFPRNVIELEVGEIQWKCDRVRSRSNGSGSIWRTSKGEPHVRESPTISALRHSSYFHLDMGPHRYGPH